MADSSPTVIVLAGPNGAGKTTSARTLLAETLQLVNYVNADVIAQGLSGFDPDSAAIEAGRIMLARLHALAEQRADFAFETTLAGRTLVSWFQTLGQAGYTVRLLYFWLLSPDLAVARVAERVRHGGHDVPEPRIRQRYQRSLRNLFGLYLPIVSSWAVYDNSQVGLPRLIAQGQHPAAPTVVDDSIWKLMQQAANP